MSILYLVKSILPSFLFPALSLTTYVSSFKVPTWNIVTLLEKVWKTSPSLRIAQVAIVELSSANKKSTS